MRSDEFYERHRFGVRHRQGIGAANAASKFTVSRVRPPQPSRRLDDDDRPILHSDQGWQYQMPQWCRMLESRNIAPSMSRKGNCLDNAAMESFFATLKSEFFYPHRFESIESLRDGVEDYIRDYNNDRIRIKLKGLSPVQYTEPSP